MKYIYDDLDGKNILITGGAGFIGSNLAHYFNKYHPRANVVVFDKFRNTDKFSNGNFRSLGHFENLLGFSGEIIVGDINNARDLAKLDSYNFDYIFHNGAISDTSCDDQELIMRTNFESMDYFFAKAKEWSSILIYASSAAVYGKTPAPNVVGENEIPQNAYGYSKLCMDNKFRALAATHDEDFDSEYKIIGLRYFNVYGAREYHKGATASMILQLGIQALRNKKVRLFEFGEQLRDFVYIKDVIQANIKAIEAKRSGIYNVGSGAARSFNDIVSILKTHLGDFEVEYIKNPYPFYQNHTQANIEKSAQELFYEPRYSLEAGIADYIPCIKELAQK